MAPDAVHFSSVGGSVRQALHSIVFIICPMNGVDWHFVVLMPASAVMPGRAACPHRVCSLQVVGATTTLPSASLSLSQGSMAGAGSLPCGDGLVLQPQSAG